MSKKIDWHPPPLSWSDKLLWELCLADLLMSRPQKALVEQWVLQETFCSFSQGQHTRSKFPHKIYWQAASFCQWETQNQFPFRFPFVFHVSLCRFTSTSLWNEIISASSSFSASLFHIKMQNVLLKGNWYCMEQPLLIRACFLRFGRNFMTVECSFSGTTALIWVKPGPN